MVESRSNPLPNEKETVIYEAVPLVGMGTDTLPLTIYTGFEWESDFVLVLYMDLYIKFRDADENLPAEWENTSDGPYQPTTMFFWW